ncbi:hypothetical protein J132_10556 [Termitomyces sp. J132]|nr:hypothetical protein J132_10556 [Termitomyces sp. J132]
MAWHVMKPEKDHDGYFSSDDIVEQASEAMDIMKEDYPEYEHIIVDNNVPLHLSSISAKKMPKNTPKDGYNWSFHRAYNWFIEVTKCTSDRKPVYNPDGTLQKIKIPMRDATLPDGQPQPLYFTNNLEHGLIAPQATWTIRKYKGHRVLPPTIKNFNAAGMAQQVERINFWTVSLIASCNVHILKKF